MVFSGAPSVNGLAPGGPMCPDVAIVVSHGFAARMVLHSDLLAEARALGLTTAVISPDVTDTSLARLAAHSDTRLVVAPSATRTSMLHGEWRPYLFEDVRTNPALWAKHLRASEGGTPKLRAQARLRLGVNRLVRAAPALQGAFDFLDRSWAASPAAVTLLRELRPRMLVSTYPVNPMETSLLLAAQTLAIPTVGHLLSWDNLTTKGRFTAIPERWVAWGPVMVEELQRLYGVAPADAIAVGVPHFDAHIRQVTAGRGHHVVADLGLDPGAPLLFFGMSAPIFCPQEIDLVEWLVSELRRDAFGPATQLVIRPHPQNVQGNMADLSWLPRLQALAGPRVAIDIPKLETSSLLWNLDPADLERMANLIGASSVTLNSGSTLCIDAIVQDRPVVMTPFDPTPGLPWWKSARRIETYPHLARLLAMGGVTVARSLDDLGQAIRADLAEPGRLSEGRARVRREELFAADGFAARRAAAAWASLLGAS